MVILDCGDVGEKCALVDVGKLEREFLGNAAGESGAVGPNLFSDI